MTRGELLERISEEERRDWYALEQIEPFGDKRQDLLHGMLCAFLANMMSNGQYAASHFMPNFEPEKPQDMFGFLTALAKAHNSKPS